MSWEHNDDDAALLRAAPRDPEAFAAFYRRYAVAVYRWFAVRVERDGAVASELTAETFAEALRSLPRFRGTVPGDGAAWLFGIARNLGREHHRHRRVRDTARRDLGLPLDGYLDEAFDHAEQRIDGEQLRRELHSALAALPAPQREAIELRIVDGLDYRTITTTTRSSEQAVRLRVFRGLRALRLRLDSTTCEEER